MARKRLSDVARAENVNPSTVFRWFRSGIKVGDRRIRLRCEYHGRKLVTTDEWIAEFHDAVTSAKLAEWEADDLDDDAERDADTEAELQAAGLLD